MVKGTQSWLKAHSKGGCIIVITQVLCGWLYLCDHTGILWVAVSLRSHRYSVGICIIVITQVLRGWLCHCDHTGAVWVAVSL